MAKIESTVTIARPVEDVFRFVLALEENAPKIDPGVESVVKTSHGPTGAGTTFRFRQKMLGRRRETTTRFISVEPNREIEFEARLGPIEPKAVLTFEQTDEGTRVTFRRAQPGRPAQVALSSLSLLSSPARVSRSGTRDWRGSRLCWRPPRPSFRRVRCRHHASTPKDEHERIEHLQTQPATKARSAVTTSPLDNATALLRRRRLRGARGDRATWRSCAVSAVAASRSAGPGSGTRSKS